MSYCTECGTRLVPKYLEKEGMIPWCERCQAYRFPTFHAAISTIVYSPDAKKVLLIKQYGRDRNILVAGYINKGEGAEHALAREVMEEMGLRVTACCFNQSEYFEKSNTLMLNFASIVDSYDLGGMTAEVDDAAWYTPAEARKAITHDSLAEKFLLAWLSKREIYDHAFDTCVF
ncbi:MAG: NUDIX domain-containing protein [Lachnospiraceae bacterium]|jgi:NAD+ diphosphatase|nr:NUDIX domain-containing protein [Lachnospiraceae bacterium]